MYIQPNTIAVLLTGVPLDETYDHTVKFASANAQRDYFLSKELMRVHPQTYQRHTENILRVEALADNLYHVNYLMFQNTSFGNKWFYAFVTKVEYVNNKTTELTYVIDVYQTWLFEMQVGQCFVEREHIVNDFIGASLTDENLEVGDLECIYSTSPFRHAVVPDTPSVRYSYYVMIASTDNSTVPTDTYGAIRISGGNSLFSLYTACSYLLFNNEQNDAGVIMDYFNDLASNDKLDTIINVTYVPAGYIEAFRANAYPQFRFAIGTEHIYPAYVPKNKKLLQYPYRFISVHTQNGDDIPFKFEYWQNPEGAVFAQGITIAPSPEIYVYPINYNTPQVGQGVDFQQQYGYEYLINAGSVPQIPFSTDSYKVWLAQNSAWSNGKRIEGSEYITPADVTRGLGSILGGAATGAVAGMQFGVSAQGIAPTQSPIAGAIAGGSAGLLNTVAKVQDKMSAVEKAKLLPAKYHGGTGYLEQQLDKLGGTFTVKAIKENFARRIDSFFEMYGYKTNELKTPNMDSRPHWNYVKTTWANINGNIPSDDITKLKAIFNNGITFWKNPSEVGNYSLNNH